MTASHSTTRGEPVIDLVTRRRQAPSRSGRRCIVTGCAADPGEELLICPVHAEALRPPPGGEAA
jgi:hypothetical protein